LFSAQIRHFPKEWRTMQVCDVKAETVNHCLVIPHGGLKLGRATRFLACMIDWSPINGADNLPEFLHTLLFINC